MARWQLYTGLRVSELLRLTVKDVLRTARRGPTIPARRGLSSHRRDAQGPQAGYVIAPTSLLEETDIYLAQYRTAWLKPCGPQAAASHPIRALYQPPRFGGKQEHLPASDPSHAAACGFKATTPLASRHLRLLDVARLEQLAKRGAAINPLLIVKILMAHEHIDTTDSYLRAVSIDTHVLAEVLETLLAGKRQP